MTVAPAMAETCVKCNVCTSACPVAAATDLFLGPKAVGPQAERLRHPREDIPDASLSWCSGCGVCSRVCPHEVPIAELNVQAKARLASQRGVSLRDQVLARPAMLARLAAPLAPLANLALQAAPARFLAEVLLGVSRSAPLPAFSRKTFRSREKGRRIDLPPAGPRPTIAYFHGCSVDHYEPDLGSLFLRIFDFLGYDVCLPPQGCCGLPLQSNGLFEAARAYARFNLRGLAPFASAGMPILGTSTSCTFALKHEYRAILGLENEVSTTVAGAVYDVFEFLRDALPQTNALDNLRRVPMRILYHPPCQLKSHGIGFPAYDVLRRIPGLTIDLSDHECCGVAGTYGLKRERYGVARDVGAGLFARIRQTAPDYVVTDSETCRWWLAGHTRVRALHPLEILARALGIEAESVETSGPEAKA